MSDVNNVISDFGSLCLSDSVSFVPPEENGCLPHNHSCEESKSQVKETDLDATGLAVEHLNAVYFGPYGYTPVSVRLSSEGMRSELEWMKFILETQGHLFDPYTRAYLLREIPILIQKINSVIVEPSSSSGSTITTCSD